mmetsp:Transcript_97384/g.303687  ORF Transcript_97384/g.303687 Transcript_97384/m.303687 type:complete len:218 (+) Transcript_97384:1283-1936(+)
MSQGAWNVGRPAGMCPTVTRMGSPPGPPSAVRYPNKVPATATTISFISVRRFMTLNLPAAGPPFLIRPLAYSFSLLNWSSMRIRTNPRVRLTGSTSLRWSQVVTMWVKKPSVCGKVRKPRRFLVCCTMIKIEPPVMNPLNVGWDKKRTAKAIRHDPMIKSTTPAMNARREASSVRSFTSGQGRSWSAMRIAAMAPDDTEACGEVPRKAYSSVGTKAQ